MDAAVSDELSRRGERATNTTDVSVVLPCLNEEASVGECIDEARRALTTAGLTCEIVVVDNGCVDRSAAVAKAHGALVVTEPRKGYGRALRSGIEAATAPIVVMADADRTYPFERMSELVQPVRDGAVDLMIGERLRAISPGAMPPLHRYIGTPILSFLVRRASNGIRVADSQSGFRAFNREKVLQLALRADGMEFASEMLIRAGQRGLRIGSVTTGYRTRVGDSKLDTLTDGWRHLQLILLMAPHVLLVWPGLTMLALGALLTLISVVSGPGITIGSLRWQPTFFSGIAVVLGLQAALAGVVLAHRSDVLNDVVRKHYAFVGHPRFARRCATVGALAALLGLAIDVALFVANLGGGPAPSRSVALASLAQSLLIGGASAAIFGVVNAVLARDHDPDERRLG